MTGPVLQVDDLHLSFAGIRALRAVSFEVGPGELFAIIGPNGAGKTSLFNCLSGLYRPQEGAIRFAGRDLVGLKPDRIARAGVARTFQNIELFEHATVLQNLLLGRHAHKRSGLVGELLFLPRVRALELAHRE
ncbi:MAG TPA: ATP-binding cassette domain-containing protein, partial [Actinomycetota bacterium]|nr:ATP-binding cassette domain-containing protein [Actinomycetota bacterium]